jgi:hypothetical protein
MDAFVGAAGGARSISQSQTTLPEPEVIHSDEEEHHQNVVQIAKQGSLGTVHTAQASIHGSCWGQKGRGQVPDDSVTVVKCKEKCIIEVWCYAAD